MKKQSLVALLLVFLCLLSLASCSSSEQSLVGRWEISIEDEALGTVDMVYHFTEEGKINLEQKAGDEIPFSIPFGTFSVQGENLTICSDGKNSQYQFFVTNDTLTLSAKDQEPLVFHRI